MYVAIVLLATVVSHVAGFELFPFGSSVGDSDLGPNDDNADLLTLNTTFRVYGGDVSIVRVSLLCAWYWYSKQCSMCVWAL